MAREEFLRAIITARESVSRSMRGMSESIQDAAQAAFQGAAAMDLYEGRVEEAGEEARETTIENLGLATSMRAVAAAAGEASVNVGPFNTSVRRAVIALPALVGLVGSLATVLGGLTVAAGGAAGALGALFAGGIVGRAQHMAETSSELEGTTDALAQMFMQFAEAVDQATQPVQTLASQQAAMEFLDGLVTLMGDLARSAARLAPLFGEVATRLGDTFWEEEARGIAQVEETITELMPLLEAMVGYILRQLPDLIGFLREETLKVGPAVADFAASLVPLIANLVRVSNILIQIIIPPLTVIVDILAVVLDLLAAVPKPLYAATIAFLATAAALVVYSGSATVATTITGLLTGAIWSLITAIAVLLAPLTGTVLVIAAVVAAIVGLITWLGLWDDIINVLIASWNIYLEAVEFAINLIITLAKVLWDAYLGWLSWIGVLDPLVNLLEYIVDLVDTAISGLNDLVRAGGRASDSLATDTEEGGIDASGGVSLDRFKGGRAEENRNRNRSESVEGRSRQVQENRTTNNFDFSGASFGSGVTDRDIERAVEKALEKKNSRTSDT